MAAIPTLSWRSGSFAMELSRGHDGLASEIEQVLDFPEALETLKSRHLSTLPRVFPAFPQNRKVMSVFLEIMHHPLERDLGVPLKPLKNVDLITLAYLRAAYAQGAACKMPFTKDFVTACKDSKEAHERAERWLLCQRGKGWRGWVAITAAAVATVATGFAALNTETDPRTLLIATPLVTLAGAWVGAACGMIFTGTQPHAASVAANNERTHIELLAKHFNAAARTLIDLYRSSVPAEKALAIRLANDIDLERLVIDYQLLALQKDTAGEVLDELGDAVAYIRFCEAPSPKPAFVFMSALEKYIAATLSLIDTSRIDALSAEASAIILVESGPA